MSRCQDSMVDGLAYQPGEPGAFCPTTSHSTLRHLRLSGLSCFEPPNLDVLQHKWPDAPKQADILAHPCTELHWQTSRASNGVSRKDAPLPGVTSCCLSQPLLCLSHAHATCHMETALREFMIPHGMKKLLPYQMAIINNYQMDVRSTSSAHFFNRRDKDWIHVFPF